MSQGAFFGQAEISESEDSSNSSSSSSSGSYSDATLERRAAKFLFDAPSEDSGADDDRQMRSPVDKARIEITDLCNSINAAIDAGTWREVPSFLDSLSSSAAKNQRFFSKHYPALFFSTLIRVGDLSDALRRDKAAMAQLEAPDARGVNSLRTRYKKNIQHFEALVDKFRASPFEDSESSGLDDASVDLVSQSEMNPDPVRVLTFFDLMPRIPAPEDIAAALTGPTILPEDDYRAELAAILAIRGRRFDVADRIDCLLRRTDKGPVQAATMLLELASIVENGTSLANFLARECWQRCYANLTRVMRIAARAADPVKFISTVDTVVADLTTSSLDSIHFSNRVVSALLMLDEELAKAFQDVDSRTVAYIDIVRDESALLSLTTAIQVLFAKWNVAPALVARVAAVRAAHLYYKSQEQYAAEAARIAHYPCALELPVPCQHTNEDGSGADFVMPTTALVEYPQDLQVTDLVPTLCRLIYAVDPTAVGPQVRVAALLQHVFCLALHGRYFAARELLLVSHVQDSILQAPEHLQILCNRALVMLACAAFRCGLYAECHSAIAEVASSARTRELLGQPLVRHAFHRDSERRSEAEQLQERRTTTPAHLQLSTEVIDAVHCAASLFIDAPALASANGLSRTAQRANVTVSKGFRRLLTHLEKQTFQGSPESTRDYVSHAAQSLLEGDWRSAAEFFTASLPMAVWEQLPITAVARRVPSCETTADRLVHECKLVALRVYLVSHAGHFEALSLSSLVEAFELPAGVVRGVVASLTSSKALPASWDFSDKEIAALVVSAERLPTRIQSLVEQIQGRSVMTAGSVRARDANRKTSA
jgi:translation initiation factor 3 subunit C